MKKSILIINTGTGFSSNLVEKLGKSGHKIGLISRSLDELILQQNRLTNRKITIFFTVADPSNERQLENAIAELESKLGTIDVLIYKPQAQKKKYIMKKFAFYQTKDFATEVTSASHCVQLLHMESVQNKGTGLLNRKRISMQPMSIICGFGIGFRGRYTEFGFLG